MAPPLSSRMSRLWIGVFGEMEVSIVSRITATTLAMVCVFTGCATDASHPEIGQQIPTELTTERAKRALVKLIQSSKPGRLKDFPLDRFINEAVIARDDTSPSWGPFSLHLKQREYTYSQAFGQPPRVCRWHYRGRFDFRDGEWIASSPEIESQELGPE